jgi:hypothetical protein
MISNIFHIEFIAEFLKLINTIDKQYYNECYIDDSSYDYEIFIKNSYDMYNLYKWNSNRKEFVLFERLYTNNINFSYLKHVNILSKPL